MTTMQAVAPFVHGDDAVLSALRRRHAAGSRPGERSDGQRIALVIGGGGMRGSYSAGMVLALDELGLRDSFDAVYGTSSGAFIAGAFVTEQSHQLPVVFYEHLASRSFVDMRRLARRAPVISLAYVIEVLTVIRPIDWHRLLESPVPAQVVATRLPELCPQTLVGLDTVADWQTAMRAASTIPLLAGRPVEFGGDRWIDGSVSEPLAVSRALADGATHVLALLCRGDSELKPVTGEAVLPMWGRALDRMVAGLGTVANGARRYGETLKMINDSSSPGRVGAHLCAIAPSHSCGVGGLTIDGIRVREACDVGYESVRSAVRALAVD
jgi:predicted patatin/cPLA2 family phospholipase